MLTDFTETDHLLVHLERLLARIEGLDAPLIQLWAWPGSGMSAVLSAFLGRQGRRAAGLSLGEIGEGDRLREAVESAREAGVRWLVASGDPGDGVRDAARWLRPGQTLVFAGTRRTTVEGLPVAVVPPPELLLDPAEVARLWELLIGMAPGPDVARRLCEASDGWYRPLCLALEATGGAGLETATPEALLNIPSVRAFLRHQILGRFTPDELELLLAAPDERPGAGEDARAWRLLDERGLWVEGASRDRLPRLLASSLERERQRRGPRAVEPVIALSASQPAGSAASGPKPVYFLGLLGPQLARYRGPEGERDLECRLKRSFQVLAYLASSPGLEAGREELIEAVWPTEGERTIERNFHPTLSHLRRALEGGRKGERPGLLFRSGVYRLNPEITWEVDVIEFTQLIEEGRDLIARDQPAEAAEVWRRAWGLYRGPFLQGHYEAWVAERRETCQRIYLDLLRDLGDLYLKLDRREEAIDAYRSVLLEDPLQERIHVALMNIYAGQGRRDMVRRQYDRLCTLLLDELGVEPLPDTTREYHRLMA